MEARGFMLSQMLRRIGNEQPAARAESFAGHPLCHFMRQEAPELIKRVLEDRYGGWLVKGSTGQGRWADVFWIATFNPIITSSALRGYYVVYLFHPEKPIVYLTLNQGATAIYEEFKSKGRKVLRDRAALMKSRISDHEISPHVTSIELGSTRPLPRGYEAGHILGCKYDLRNLPSEDSLQKDLLSLCKAYATLEFRGGSDDLEDVVSEDGEVAGNGTIEELRRYRAHYRIERNSSTAKAVKRVHGYECQACRADFQKLYGDLGKGYIEAHHKKPLSTLEAGITTRYDVDKDFAVLCSNCHRMIHRLDDPSDLDLLIDIINKNRQ